MGTSRMSPTIIASSAQAQPVQSPFQINNLPGAVTAQVNTHDGRLLIFLNESLNFFRKIGSNCSNYKVFTKSWIFHLST